MASVVLTSRSSASYENRVALPFASVVVLGLPVGV
jgi:hypothetical protein